MKSLRDEIRTFAGFGLRDLYGVVVILKRSGDIYILIKWMRSSRLRYASLEDDNKDEILRLRCTTLRMTFTAQDDK